MSDWIRKKEAEAVDEVIASIRRKSNGRTCFEGQPPYEDELLVEELDRLTARVKVLEDALRPFSDAWESLEDHSAARELFSCLSIAQLGRLAEIMVGGNDFRRARAIFKGEK